MHREVAERLAELYEVPFGGKERGRFRVSMKLMCELFGRRRLYDEDKRKLSRELFELGYVLVDMDTFFGVMSQRTMASYRRVNAEHLEVNSTKTPSAAAKRKAH